MSILSTNDEGKYLMDAEGEQIGIVTGVDPEQNVAFIEPDPNLTEAWVQSLGYGDADEDDIEVPGESVDTVTDTEIRVPKDL
jgi:hypothetical protein